MEPSPVNIDSGSIESSRFRVQAVAVVTLALQSSGGAETTYEPGQVKAVLNPSSFDSGSAELKYCQVQVAMRVRAALTQDSPGSGCTELLRRERESKIQIPLSY